MKNIARAACIFASALAAGGCFDYKQHATIYPDGSGKFELTLGMKKKTVEAIENLGRLGGNPDPETPLDSFGDLKKLEANSRGIAAWARPKWTEDGEFLHVAVTGYFEDVSKARVYTTTKGADGVEERKLVFGCAYKENESGYTLVIDPDSRNELIPDEENARNIRPLVDAFGGVKVSIRVTVPGPITEATGFLNKEGRTASLVMDFPIYKELIVNPDSEKSKALTDKIDVDEARIVWKETATEAADLAAFREELEEAKKAWAKLKADAAPKEKETQESP